MNELPFLTAYDPSGSSEGSIDPLGLNLIAERLATELVPAVRERMRRIRFLTVMAVGSLVIEGMDRGSSGSNLEPYEVWEWLTIEAFVRTRRASDELWGVPGILVTGRAIDSFGYVDRQSYLKNARIFGFHGVYKRLAHHLGIVDVNLAPSIVTENIVHAWVKSLGETRSKEHFARWSNAVESSLVAKPRPRTAAGFKSDDWEILASAFLPGDCRGQERELLRDLLVVKEPELMGALPIIWKLQDKFTRDNYGEEGLHHALGEIAPTFRPLLQAIRAYEAFARRLLDAFDLLRAEASPNDQFGYRITDIAKDCDFVSAVTGLDQCFAATLGAFGDLGAFGSSLQGQFADRFKQFELPIAPDDYARELCDHHAAIQRLKSEDGKRTWFDKLDQDRIFIRYPYRVKRRELNLNKYVHYYRGWSIRYFWEDLA